MAEKKGKLVAMVHFNNEELEQKVKEMTLDFTHKMDEKIEEVSQKVEEIINELAAELQHYINSFIGDSDFGNGVYNNGNGMET